MDTFQDPLAATQVECHLTSHLSSSGAQLSISLARPPRPPARRRPAHISISAPSASPHLPNSPQSGISFESAWMEITVPYSFVDSDDDSSSGTSSPVATSSSFANPRVNPSDALPEWQCKYTGKICPHPRARKTNGKLHRLCEQHRVRANVNQRRLQQKRREARAGMGSPYNRSPSRAAESLNMDWDDLMVEILREDQDADLDPLIFVATTHEPLTTPSQPTEEDLAELKLLLTSSVDSTENERFDVLYDIFSPSTH